MWCFNNQRRSHRESDDQVNTVEHLLSRLVGTPKNGPDKQESGCLELYVTHGGDDVHPSESKTIMTSVSDGEPVTVGLEVTSEANAGSQGSLTHMWDTHGRVLQWKWR